MEGVTHRKWTGNIKKLSLVFQVHLYDFEGEIACHEGTLYRNCRLITKTIKVCFKLSLPSASYYATLSPAGIWLLNLFLLYSRSLRLVVSVRKTERLTQEESE